MVRVAFYKAKGNWLDWVIRKWTKGKYSHCELVLGDQWLSASPREKVVRYKAILDTGEWDFIEVDLNRLLIEHIQHWAELELGCKYDWLGIILTQIVNLNKQDPERWFCSELVVMALQQTGMLLNVVPHQIDPNELYKLLGGPNG